MLEDPPAPPALLRTILYHITGAIPQLRSYIDTGPTLYALTVFGVKPETMGGATLVGPAVDYDGLEGWPAGAAAPARAVLAQPGFRRAGAVLVFVTLQAGRVSHCVPIGIPSALSRAERRPPAQGEHSPAAGVPGS